MNASTTLDTNATQHDTEILKQEQCINYVDNKNIF